MPTHLSVAIDKHNQQILETEYSAALIIRDRLAMIIDDLSLDDALKKEIVDKCDLTLKAMLYAENKEELILQQKRLSNLLSKLKIEADKSNDELTMTMQQFRFYQHIHTLLRKSKYNNFKDLYGKLPPGCTEVDKFKQWRIKLNELTLTNTERSFTQQKKQLLSELDLEFKDVLNNKTASSFVLIEDNIQVLNRCRQSYLEEVGDLFRIRAKMAWVFIDFAILITATVLGLAFPILGVPILALAIGSLTYATIDFTKNTLDLYSENNQQPLGNRELKERTKQKLRDKLQKKLDIDVDALLDRHLISDEAWLTEKKWLERLSYAVCIVGVVLAIVGISALLFPLGITFTAVIVGTFLSILVPTIGASIFAWQVFKQRQRLEEISNQIDQTIEQDTNDLAKSFDPPILNNIGIPAIGHVDDSLSTTAYLIKQGIMARTSNHQTDSAQVISSPINKFTDDEKIDDDDYQP